MPPTTTIMMMMSETTTQPMTVKGDSQVAFNDDQNVEQPTGFILKLFQMIHGAPEERAWRHDFGAGVIQDHLRSCKGTVYITDV
jgi:hypothetical protein